MEEAIREAGLKGIRKFITRRQNTVVQYIVTRTIMDLCEWSAWRTGATVSRKWWEQDSLYLEGSKKRSAAAV